MPKGIHVRKTIGLCNCITCYYWCFFEITTRFQPKIFNGCHDLMQKAMSFNVSVEDKNSFFAHE